MERMFEQLYTDLYENPFSYQDIAFDKIQTKSGYVSHGQRIYWYYTEDDMLWNEYYPEFDLQLKRDQQMYGGIVIAEPHTAVSGFGKLLEPEQAVVIVDTEPVAKASPECAWISFVRILSDEDLVEIYSEDGCTI